MKNAVIPILALVLAACGESAVNPPTDPADPIVRSDQPEIVSVPGRTPTMPGRGPASFVGQWAARTSWCANRTGPNQPIEITTTRFEGYENGCDITEIGEVQGGYIAYLSCGAEGVASAERLRLSVADQTLTLTWIDRADIRTELKRCPAPATPAPSPPS